LLSNKNLLYAVSIFLVIIIITSCSDKGEKVPVLDYNNKAQLLEVVKKHYNPNAVFATGGIFDDSGKQMIGVGIEVENNEDWGIKFALLQTVDEHLTVKFESELLDGSFKESLIDKIKFSSFGNELLYYNSQSYFMGSGGGEIFSYIVNFNDKEIYYAHLVVEPSNVTSLFISDNTENKEIKNFFNLTFKKDYPNLKIVTDDIIFE
jgi:hypothetical protein